MLTKKCTNCRSFFQTEDRYQIYCCYSCKSQFKKEERYWRQHPHRDCIVCKEKFIFIDKLQTVCSDCEDYSNIVDKYCSKCKKKFKGEKYDKNRFCSATCKGSFRDPKVNHFEIFKRDNFTCIYCGLCSLTDKVKLHVEHILPIAKGGSSNIGNLITSCSRCNGKKKDNPLKQEQMIKLWEIVGSRIELSKDDIDYSAIQEYFDKIHKSRITRLTRKI